MIGYYEKAIKDILEHSQEYPFELNATRAIAEKWYEAKKPFIDLFGGKTYVRSMRPIKVNLTTEQRSRKFWEFIDALRDNDILTEELRDFLSNNEEGFFDNIVTVPYEKFHIPAGAKMSKSLKRFIDTPNIVRWAQDLASRFMQEDKLEGYIYLSVDPIDFLTISENTLNWTSCHALDGDYRAGDLSYMCDKTTMVAFIASDEKEFLPCLPIDYCAFNKKWRMLIHTDLEKKSCVYYNRPYPFDACILKWLNTFVLDTLQYPLGDFGEPCSIGLRKIADDDNAINLLDSTKFYYGLRVFDASDVLDTSEYLGYNDLAYSFSYRPYCSVNEAKALQYQEHSIGASLMEEFEEFKKVFGIKIGATVPCPCCGEEELTREDRFICTNCISTYDADEDFFLKCEGCGRHIYEQFEDVFWDDTLACYCKHCYKLLQEEEDYGS